VDCGMGQEAAWTKAYSRSSQFDHRSYWVHRRVGRV
jgi:hypothetical protein